MSDARGYAISQTESAKFDAAPNFELPWSEYVSLLAVKGPAAQQLYEREAPSSIDTYTMVYATCMVHDTMVYMTVRTASSLA